MLARSKRFVDPEIECQELLLDVLKRTKSKVLLPTAYFWLARTVCGTCSTRLLYPRSNLSSVTAKKELFVPFCALVCPHSWWLLCCLRQAVCSICTRPFVHSLTLVRDGFFVACDKRFVVLVLAFLCPCLPSFVMASLLLATAVCGTCTCLFVPSFASDGFFVACDSCLWQSISPKLMITQTNNLKRLN